MGWKGLPRARQTRPPDTPEHGGGAVPHGRHAGCHAATPQVRQGIGGNQNLKRRLGAAPFFVQCPTANLNIRLVIGTSAPQIGFDGAAYFGAPIRVPRLRGLRYPKLLVGYGIAMNQVSCAPYDILILTDE